MRFSTIAVSAAVFGATAMALPGNVVYQTDVVTITSCAPEKTNCPGKSTAIPVVSTPAVSTPVCPGGPNCYSAPPAPSSGHSHPVPGHPNSTYVSPGPSVSKPVCPGGPHCPPAATVSPVCPGAPNCPSPSMTSKGVYSVPGTGAPYVPSGTGVPYVPSGTGVPYPTKNASVPAPTTPPSYTGSGSIQSFSILAVGIAVAAFFL